MKIMIVEDDEDLCSTIEFALKKEGHDVVGVAIDGEMALDIYQAAKNSFTASFVSSVSSW